MPTIIIGTTSLTVMSRVLWFSSHYMENKLSLNQAPRPYGLEASDVTMHVHGGMTNPVSSQEFSTKLSQTGIQLTSICDDVAILPSSKKEWHVLPEQMIV